MSTLTIADRAALHRTPSFRAFDLTSVECRDSADGTGFTFEGVASVVDVPYTVHDQFGSFEETIRSGSFTKTLKDPGADVALFVNHRHADIPMASTRAGTMRLTADPHLRAVAELDSVRSDVVIARSAVQRGELPQMSIGFNVPKDARKDVWSDDFSTRTIHELILKEVSIVRQGANPHTEASVRSYTDFMREISATDMTEAQLHRAIKALEARFPDVFTDEVETWLVLALKERFASQAQSEWAMLNVEDFTDSTVVFCLYGYAAEGMFQLGYSLASDHTVTLADSDPIEVVEISTYQPAARSAEFLARDRADRERLERLKFGRPPFT